MVPKLILEGIKTRKPYPLISLKFGKMWNNNQTYVVRVYWKMAMLCKRFAKNTFNEKVIKVTTVQNKLLKYVCTEAATRVVL